MPLECVVCGTLLTTRSPGAVGPYPICHAVPCRMVLDQRATLGEAAFRQHLHWRARNTREQRARARAEDERLRTLTASESAENLAQWAAVEAHLPSHQADQFIRLALPSGPARQRKPAQGRRHNYRDHLKDIIAQATLPNDEAPPADVVATASGSTLPGQVCALCRGGCCTRGGDTAYLSADTVRRVMAQQPHWRPEEVMSAYLDRLAPKTQAGSCINHTAGGCALPREMRSDVCNRYLCDSQKELQGRLDEAPALRGVVVVQRRQDHWSRHLPERDNGVVGAASLTESSVSPGPGNS
ncbi:MAG: hypothetical protein C0487_05530 [Leptothrix sp. (in: Bacteria)]|nr:hypothetical protein [Leptothrix sp. (in: b-proteobacteria)]